MSDNPNPSKMAQWWQRCRGKWIAVASVVSLFAGLAVAQPYIASKIPWAPKEAVAQLAERVYPQALANAQLREIILTRKIKQLEALPGKDAEQYQELNDLRRDLIDLQDEIQQLFRERAKFRLYGGHTG